MRSERCSGVALRLVRDVVSIQDVFWSICKDVLGVAAAAEDVFDAEWREGLGGVGGPGRLSHLLHHSETFEGSVLVTRSGELFLDL